MSAAVTDALCRNTGCQSSPRVVRGRSNLAAEGERLLVRVCCAFGSGASLGPHTIPAATTVRSFKVSAGHPCSSTSMSFAGRWQVSTLQSKRQSPSREVRSSRLMNAASGQSPLSASLAVQPAEKSALVTDSSGIGGLWRHFAETAHPWLLNSYHGKLQLVALVECRCQALSAMLFVQSIWVAA